MLSILQDAVNNPDMAESFTILRNPGQFAAGGWQVRPQQKIPVYGTVGLATNKDLEMVKEADRVHEIRMFHSSTEMRVTSAEKSLAADILLWRGVRYRVVVAINRGERGYYGALAARMSGS